jgi:hypothetical protein
MGLVQGEMPFLQENWKLSKEKYLKDEFNHHPFSSLEDQLEQECFFPNRIRKYSKRNGLSIPSSQG